VNGGFGKGAIGNILFGMKRITGLIWITFIDLLRTISSFLVYSHAPGYVDMIQDKQFVYTNAASSIIAVLLGLYLLKSGKFFIRMSLKSIASRTDED